MELQEKKIWIKHGNVNYAEAGEGLPMVFLHNGGGFWQSWNHQIEYFAKDYKVYALDWPTFGESDIQDGLMSLEFLYEVLNDFITELDLENIILVGNCIGASVAYRYKSRHDENVSKLILFNICPGDLILPKFIFRKLLPRLNNYPRFKRVGENTLKFFFLKTPLKKKFPSILFGDKDANRDSFVFRKYEEKFKTDKQTYARVNLLFSAHTYTFTDHLQKEGVLPSMMIWGGQNSVTSYKKHGIHHVELVQPERMEVIDGGGHLCMYEFPQEVNQMIEEYIAS